jgi:hypothetical protein
MISHLFQSSEEHHLRDIQMVPFGEAPEHLCTLSDNGLWNEEVDF